MLKPISEIKVDDSKRHRKELSGIPELVESIKRIGLLNPVIIDANGLLLAGRRRLEAYKVLGHETIPVKLYESLDPSEQKLVELDENLRRVDITWSERALAILELHELRASQTIEQTADYIGLESSIVANSVQVGRELRKGNPKILACSGLRQAIELLRRSRAIALDTAFSKDPTLSLGREPEPYDYEEDPGGGPRSLTATIKARELGQPGADLPEPDLELDGLPQPSKFNIIQADFIEFARTYRGPKFNFIHCDFPYGVNLQSSAAASAAAHESQYDDSQEVYFSLLSAFLDNQDNFILESAHCLFWFSMKFYEPTVAAFRRDGWFVHEHPLIWFKSDNMGIASDFRRRPKHIYETALWMSRGDRQLVQLRGDCFPHPIAKVQEGHLSAKPQAMLEFFLSMGVSEHTDFLDPTCGSGTSIRAARKLGAARGLGLELNAETAKAAALKLELEKA